MRQTSTHSDLIAMCAQFAALASATRLALLVLLKERAYSVTELVQMLGAKQSNVSKQLGILKSAGLVDSIRRGNCISYFLAKDSIVRLLSAAVQILQRNLFSKK